MKKIMFLLTLLLLSSMHTVYADEIHRAEVSRLPKTHNYNDIQLFSEDTFESRITEAWEIHLEEVDISDLKIPTSEFEDMYEDVFYHNPLFYYVSNEYGYSSKKGYVTKVYPYYDETDPDTIADTLASIRAEAALMLMEIDVGMTDFEKVMAIHDYMVMNYEYDTDLSIYNVTVMTKKKGVCMAYSLAFNYMMELLGIESAYVCSEVMDHS